VEEAQPEGLQLYGRALEQVESFKYLGRIVTADDDDGPEITARLQQARGTMAGLKRNVLNPACITKKTKLRVLQTVCSTQVKYGCESWRITSKEEAQLRTWQQRCLRQATGMHPMAEIGEDGEKQIRFPKREAVLESAGATDIVHDVHHTQMRWYGHALRMDQESAVRRSYSSCLEGRGRPGFTDEKLISVQLQRRMEACRLEPQDAKDREKWRKAIGQVKREDVRQGAKEKAKEERAKDRARPRCGVPMRAGGPCQRFQPCRLHPGPPPPPG